MDSSFLLTMSKFVAGLLIFMIFWTIVQLLLMAWATRVGIKELEDNAADEACEFKDVLPYRLACYQNNWRDNRNRSLRYILFLSANLAWILSAMHNF